nr:hypothetical protein [Gammaproteobacteria bacterium]
MKRLFNTAFSGREGDRLPAIIEHLRSLDTQSLPVQLKIIRNLSFLTTDIQKRAEIYGADGLFILLNLLRKQLDNDEQKENISPQNG